MAEGLNTPSRAPVTPQMLPPASTAPSQSAGAAASTPRLAACSVPSAGPLRGASLSPQRRSSRSSRLAAQPAGSAGDAAPRRWSLDDVALPPASSPEYTGEASDGNCSPDYKRQRRVLAPLGQAGHSVHEAMFARALERSRRGYRNGQRRVMKEAQQELSPEARQPRCRPHPPPQPQRKRQWGHLEYDSVRNIWFRADGEWRQSLQETMRFCANRLSVLLRELRTRRRPQTLSLTMHYLWRFYHGTGQDSAPHSFEDFDQRLMMCACLFLASKNENSRFPLGDLVIKVFGHAPSQEPGCDYHKRWRQITQAELYLIAAVLRFDFSFQDPQKLYAEVLAKITGLGHAGLVGLHGIPWVIGGLQCFPLVFQTPLCIHYEPLWLARGMLRLAREWWQSRFGDQPWVRPLSDTQPATPLTVDEDLWDQETYLPDDVFQRMRAELAAEGLEAMLFTQYDRVLQRQSASRARSSASAAPGFSPFVPHSLASPFRMDTPTPPPSVSAGPPFAPSPPQMPETRA
eukprot:TRINITY_DN20022_c0_g1_i1.p1 TRINITY_DN20022_c0_g1~~TRINITY_DN20022_c0_g1_i1.p1  ORF type:complete len:516 (+),score=113.53 TRINITY_DN20022_c0_g1_i1:90-1637(+)